MSSTTAPIERPRISACIITFNEADRIADCLASLDFCDEWIVVDSFSSDDTVAIAQAAEDIGFHQASKQKMNMHLKDDTANGGAYQAPLIIGGTVSAAPLTMAR